jgi:hypothetical protein
MTPRLRTIAVLGSVVALVPIVAGGCNGEIRFGDPIADAATLGPEAGAVEGATEGAAAVSTCAIDHDCRLSSLHCEPTLHVCVACLEHGHCGSAKLPRCDPSKHRCVECDTPEDCGAADLTCDPGTLKCVRRCGTGCPSDAPTCDVARGVCVGCTVDATCSGATPVCEPGSGRCVECVKNKDCTTAKSHCDPSLGVCVACLTSAECNGQACDPGSGECVDQQN